MARTAPGPLTIVPLAHIDILIRCFFFGVWFEGVDRWEWAKSRLRKAKTADDFKK